MKVLVRGPMLFDAEVVRRLPDGRVIVKLAPRRAVVEADDVDPSLQRLCDALEDRTRAGHPEPCHGDRKAEDHG